MNCLSFPLKSLTFAATFPTAVLKLIFEHNSDAGVSESQMTPLETPRRVIPTVGKLARAALSSIAVGQRSEELLRRIPWTLLKI